MPYTLAPVNVYVDNQHIQFNRVTKSHVIAFIFKRVSSCYPFWNVTYDIVKRVIPWSSPLPWKIHVFFYFLWIENLCYFLLLLFLWTSSWICVFSKVSVILSSISYFGLIKLVSSKATCIDSSIVIVLSLNILKALLFQRITKEYTFIRLCIKESFIHIIISLI